MSSNDSTPERLRATLRHPLADVLTLNSIAGQRDALENSACVLDLLSDLFGSEADDFTPLASIHARRGLWILLEGVADTLRAVSDSMAAPE